MTPRRRDRLWLGRHPTGGRRRPEHYELSVLSNSTMTDSTSVGLHHHAAANPYSTE